MNIEVFDGFAKYYDTLASDIDFVERQISVLTSIFERYRVKTVLDCACGTGSAVIRLKELGYDVVGTDGSDGMLAIAREKASGKDIACQFYDVEWVHLDRFADEIDREFDAIACVGNSIFYSPPAALSSIFAGICKLLRGGGVCIVDNRHWVRNAETGSLEEAERKRLRDWEVLTWEDPEIRENREIRVSDICEYEGGKQVITYSIEHLGTHRIEQFAFVGFPVLSEDMGKVMGRQGFGDVEIAYDSKRWKYEIITARKC